jgi:hypothetical protein
VARPVALCIVSLCAAIAAGCGGRSPSRRATARTTTPTTSSFSRCRTDSARAKRALPRLRADIAAIRRAPGHARTSVATDAFIADLERSGLSLLTENRLIDFAAEASVGKCRDCFQALEAMRPIPSLAHGSCR